MVVVMVMMVNVMAMVFDHDGFGAGSGRSEGGNPDEGAAEGEEGFHRFVLRVLVLTVLTLP